MEVIFIPRVVIPLSTFGEFTTGPLAPRYSTTSIRILEQGSKSQSRHQTEDLLFTPLNDKNL